MILLLLLVPPYPNKPPDQFPEIWHLLMQFCIFNSQYPKSPQSPPTFSLPITNPNVSTLLIINVPISAFPHSMDTADFVSHLIFPLTFKLRIAAFCTMPKRPALALFVILRFVMLFLLPSRMPINGFLLFPIGVHSLLFKSIFDASLK